MKSEYEYRVLNRKGLSELGQGVENDKKTFSWLAKYIFVSQK